MKQSISGSGKPNVTIFGKSRRQSIQHFTEAELNEIFPRQLESVNPLKSTNVVHFDNIRREYVPSAQPAPVINLFHFKSSAILKTSPEALEADDFDEYIDIFVKSCSSTKSGTIPPEFANNLDEDQNDIETVQAIYMAARPQKEKKIVNAFNFSEEASQTATSSFRTIESQTIPPVTKDFSYSITLSKIFDKYAAGFMEKEKKMNPKKPIENDNIQNKQNENSSMELMERVICQNLFSQIYLDFRYFEDPADQFRTDGRLLPLWSFSLPHRQIVPITDIEWNHDCYDLFAVSFGDDDDVEKGGVVATYSIKKCLHPSFLVDTISPAMCVSISSHYTSLLAVGFFDGHVSVYDSLLKNDSLVHSSNIENKHTNCVNAVRWQHEKSNFYSISSDGIVKNWHVGSMCLMASVNFNIEMPSSIKLGPEGMKLNVKCGGLRFAFPLTESNVYLLGTAEGFIMKCSTLRIREPLFIYCGHRLPVYRIGYNPFVQAIFISCSADWTVQIWEDNRSEPLLIFDLGVPVIDVKWSPYTSTVFAAVTRDGYVHIYDLNINHYRAIHKQKVVSTAKGNAPTQLSFNKQHAVMIVGDKKGHIILLKLSPNLRILAKASKKETMQQNELEIRKFHSFLSLMKPKILPVPLDVPTL